MLLLTKFDVAERQLHEAITLFFAESDPVSIHTLAEAANQVLYDLRTQFGGQSFRRDSDKIRDEYKKEWLSTLTAARNFFKHADRDREATFKFNPTLNEFVLMDSVFLYLAAKKTLSPETLLFFCWTAAAHPRFFKKDAFPAHVAGFMLEPDAKNLTIYRAVLAAMRSGEFPAPGVELRLGLPLAAEQPKQRNNV